MVALKNHFGPACDPLAFHIAAEKRAAEKGTGTFCRYGPAGSKNNCGAL
jgi:hypothetical protein